jgi:hypothetical protein
MFTKFLNIIPQKSKMCRASVCTLVRKNFPDNYTYRPFDRLHKVKRKIWSTKFYDEFGLCFTTRNMNMNIYCILIAINNSGHPSIKYTIS